MERLNLKGSAYKRLAVVQHKQDRKAALAEMGVWYGKAQELATQEGDQGYYSELMVMTAEILAQHADGSPGDAERRKRLKRIAGNQRKRFAELFRHCKVSAVSDHRVTRGIITAMGWLGLQIRAASWDNLREAIDYLEPNGTTAADVQALTLKLRDKSMRLDSVA